MINKEEIKRAIYYRGKFLHYMAIMENQLNLFLSLHFCGEDIRRRMDMQLLILGDERITLSNKAQIFHFIAKNYHKKWYNDYESIFGNMNKDMVEVIEARNLFAHRIMEDGKFPLWEEKADGSIRFIRYKNTIDPIEYNNEKFNELIKTIKALELYIHEKIILIKGYISPLGSAGGATYEPSSGE